MLQGVTGGAYRAGKEGRNEGNEESHERKEEGKERGKKKEGGRMCWKRGTKRRERSKP